LRNYLIPFFGDKPLSQVTSGAIQEYRIDRIEKSKEKRGKAPARNTLHQEMVALRQSLKTALRHGWLSSLPDMSQPYRSNGKISHRAWFSPVEYSSTSRPRNERKTPKKSAIATMVKNSMTSSSSWPTRACDLMKLSASNIAT